ncbi:MAG: PEP-CTERM sorting domain-containing protein [Verrucomicrobiaceae bacterium]|nr:MAG: PEP-CTERM sorting domain-containing protein [Verrucomicrobiaceae bacterium]
MRKTPLLAVVVALAITGTTRAATISITTADGLGADTHVRNDVTSPANNAFNYGSATSMLLGSNAGNTPSSLLNLLLRFDLSALQTAAAGSAITVNSITLSLTTAATAGGASGGLPFTVGLHDYGFSFVEGSANGTAQAGSSTYLNPAGDGSDTTAGGTAGNSLQTLSITSVGINTVWTFSSSAAFIADIQNAYAPAGTSVLNYLLKETDTGGDWATDQTFVRINSGEATPAELRPTLTIDYSVVPEPTTALLGLSGILAMVFWRRR